MCVGQCHWRHSACCLVRTICEGFLRLQWCAHDAISQILFAPSSEILNLASIDVVKHAVEGEVPSEGVLLWGAKSHFWDSVCSIADVCL